MQSLNIFFIGKNQVETRSEPVRALAPNEVLVASHKTLISTGTEGICLGRLFESGTHWDAWVKYPFSPGYCQIGHVVAVGKDVTDFQEGQRVAARSPHRQFNIVPAARLYPLPDAVQDEEAAAWFGLASIVQNGVRHAEHALGDTVVIVGAGPLGQLVTQYVRLLGARAILVVDPASRRVETACAHGATVGLALPVEQAKEQILEATGGGGADVVYDVTGNAAVLEHALPLARRFGTLLLLGDTGSPAQQRLTKDVVTRGLHIIGAHDTNPPPVAGDHTPWSHKQMVRLFFQYLADGKMRTADLITHRFAPRKAPEAYRLLQEDRPNTLGVLFDWTEVP
jgi:2-desacetyl-2-hydroxyethyl bacteriochlorophyllide A dehydrogenase